MYWGHVDLRGNQYKQKEIDSGEKLGLGGGQSCEENSGVQHMIFVYLAYYQVLVENIWWLEHFT